MKRALYDVQMAAARWRDRRTILEQHICDAHASGQSLRAIAGAAGISHEQVRRIVKEGS